ncbi:hypothetical protein P9D42_15445 [Bacillus haynesii]|uniref:hypothetical protein n=1 Tax=Bacillus haynesii TaxID=1925021 RepID=UPI002DB66936|nr:hypothetical protein [Bacillus haynesii]MEC1507039.1 hypothetical protein [Bacillus haynesii]
MAKTKKYVRILKAKYESMWYADKIGEVFELTGETVSFYDVRVPGVGRLVNVEDAELIVTEKRPAKVGERVLITAYPYERSHLYDKYQVIYPVSSGSYAIHPFNKDVLMFLNHEQYEVIVNNEVKNEEADGMENVEQRYDIAVETSRDAIEELRLAAYAKGFEDARRELTATAPIEKTAQKRRDEIVEQAKADVERLSNRYLRNTYCGCSTKFAVNHEKRTVVALLKGVITGKVYTKGIAKAAPDDCFNVHIGKAIALHRALGLEVPDEYLNAPQPTEVRVGDVVRSTVDKSKKYVIAKGEKAWHEGMAGLSSMVAKYGRINDDSRTEVGEWL